MRLGKKIKVLLNQQNCSEVTESESNFICIGWTQEDGKNARM